MPHSPSSPASDGPSACAILVAGGTGLRAKTSANELPKQFADLAGKPLIAHALETFLTHRAIQKAVLVLPDPDDVPTTLPTSDKLHKVRGGASRAASVYAGLRAYVALGGPQAFAHVLVHDGARPFTSPALIDAVLAGLQSAAGVIPALQITDTIKWQDNGMLTQGPKRERLATVQTPQGFDGALLLDAHEKADSFVGTLPVFTDDASIMEWAGHACRAVAGEQDNIKITTPQDWARAHAILASRASLAVKGNTPS